MENSPLIIGTIHYDPKYINFQFNFNTFPFYLAITPWLYVLPSFVVICRIFNVYLTSNWNRAEPGKNEHVFLVISLSQLTCSVFFFFDYLMIRLPASGIFTSYCARNDPNHWMKWIFFIAMYSNYSAMVFPFLVPVIRLMIVMYPKDHKKINTILVRVGVPFILIYPIFFTFFLIPALGVCRQIKPPYPFGAVGIYYAGAMTGLRNSYFFLCNTAFWLALSVLANALLFVKVSIARSKLISLQKNGVSYRAETSMTITTLTMIAFYICNGSFVLFYLMYYNTSSYVSYATILRSFGNDMQTCVVSWVFYLTHPVFKKKTKKPSDVVFSTSSYKRKIEIINKWKSMIKVDS